MKPTNDWQHEFGRLSEQSPQTEGLLTTNELLEHLRSMPGNDKLTLHQVQEFLDRLDSEGRLYGAYFRCRGRAGRVIGKWGYRMKVAEKQVKTT